MKKQYIESNVVRKLSEKASISIDTVNKVIKVQKDNTDVGNGSWGKIDYLCKVHSYIYLLVGKIAKKKKIYGEDTDEINIIDNKTNKREMKVNMANMSKIAMKNVKK